MSEMCCTRLAENTGRKSYAKTRHMRTFAQICPGSIFATKAFIDNPKILLNSNICSTCPHNVLTEIGWGVWGTPANFSGFRVFASLLHPRRSTEVNQTMHDI